MVARVIFVDSSVWISFFRRLHTQPVAKFKAIEQNSQILVGDLVLLEVLQGARDTAHAIRLEELLRRFPTTAMMDEGLAVMAARNYRTLRASGITIRKTVDLIIATFCIAEGHELLHDDRDFIPFETHLGLRVH